MVAWSSSSSPSGEVQISVAEVRIWWSDLMVAGSSRPSSGPPLSSSGCSGPRQWLVSSFILSVLLGLAFGLPSMSNEVEVKVRCAVVHSKVVGGAALVVHPKAQPSSLSLLRRVDLDGGLVVMRHDRGACLHLS
jgi:hypothetical protein